MKKVLMALAILLMVGFYSAEASIVLAPVAEGSSGNKLYTTTGTPTPIASSINGLPNYYSSTYSQNIGPFIDAERVIRNTGTMMGSSATANLVHFYKKGILEFDISSVGAGTYSAVLTLDFYGVEDYSGPAVTLKLYDMSESTEDGDVMTGETKGSYIADIFTISPSSAPAPGIYSFDVTSAIASDIANMPGNTFAGFVLDYSLVDPSLPYTDYVNDIFPTVHFNNYDESTGEGSTLTLREETTPVPEPSTVMLIGTGLVGIYFARRKKD